MSLEIKMEQIVDLTGAYSSEQWGAQSAPEEETVHLPDGNVVLNMSVHRDILLNTRLHHYCTIGNVQGVMEMIRSARHPILFNIQNAMGQTALHVAAKAGRDKIVRLLLTAGADPHLSDCMGYLPLHIACIEGSLECVEALTVPVSEPELEMAKSLIGNRLYNSWISAGSPVDMELSTFCGDLPVHLTAKHGHVDLMHYLVTIGCNINAATEDRGLTPLHIAIEEQDDLVFQYLTTQCRAMLDVELPSLLGITAFQFAAVLKRDDYEKVLQDLGATPRTPPAGMAKDQVFGYYEDEDDNGDEDDMSIDSALGESFDLTDCDFSEMDESF